jgi:hypothetical protein
MDNSAMRALRPLIFNLLAFLCALASLFFGYYGAQLVYAALTYKGEGSLGHVGMYIAAGLFPFLAAIFAALTYLAWRSARRNDAAPLPPA